MRALVAASLVMVAFGVVLLAGPPRQRATSEDPRAAGDTPMGSLPAAPETSTARNVEIRGSAAPETIAAGAGTRAMEARAPARIAARGETTPQVDPRSRAASGGSAPAAPGVRTFVPGSRGHAQAVASTLESEDYARVVEPVARLYLAYFGRIPDYEGLRWYMDEHGGGTPLPEIADEFAGSPEFGARYGELDNAAFVDRIYRNVHGGDADARRAFWIAQLDSGALTRGDVMLAFSEDARFRAATGHAVFVTMAYAEVFQRAPTPAELARWQAFLEAGRPHGALLDALVEGRAKK